MSDSQKTSGKDRNQTKQLILGTALAVLIAMVILAGFILTGNETLRPVMFIVSILGILLVLFLFILIYRFFNAVKIINDNSRLLSQGKLNISDIIVDDTKGLESMSLAFNDMKTNLLGFIESTKGNVVVLSDAIDKVSKSIDMSYRGNEQIASNMTTVAQKASDQLQIVKNTIARIEDASQRMGNITSSIAKIEDFVENTANLTREGSKQLDKYDEQMKVISENLSETYRFIQMLNIHLKEINQVGGFIMKITEQLKLLSLNSAVEAARAGEAGKGFSVVSQEMTKLSKATRENIGRINKLLVDILDSNSKVSKGIENCVESYNISNKIFDVVKESFHTINKNSSILNNNMKEVYEEAQLIDENAHGINEKSSILLKASNEISSITQDVAAVTEEELAENQEINSQAMALKEMLRGIDQLLVRYRTAVIPVKEDSPKKLKFIMLSPLDHSFWRSLRQGVLYAESELKSKNVEIEYIGLNPMSNDKFVQIMNDKIEAGCDGIIVPGFVAGMDPYIEKAQKKNITILTFNCDLTDSSKRLAYFGPDVSHQGTLAGELMAKHCNNSGDVAIFFGNQNDSINKIRKDAVTASLKKRKVKIMAEVQAVDDNELVYNKAKEILSKYNNLKGIVITSGGAIGLARAIEELGLAGSTKIVCFDYDKEIFDLIKKDIVYAAMGQDPFGQGHDPIISLFNYFTANEIPDSITHTRIEVVDKRNVYDLA